MIECGLGQGKVLSYCREAWRLLTVMVLRPKKPTAATGVSVDVGGFGR